MISALKKVGRAQELLGEINDCEMARGLLSQYKVANGVTSWLRRRQHRKIDEFQRY
jgi:CHAD domain-containing protein